jgi:glycosyltransferase involved in cell wall biosynthesis
MAFVSWIAHSRRSQLIADKFGMRLYLVHALKRRPWLAPLRYLLQSLQTLRLLFRDRPRVVFVQNPPIFAALMVYLYARLTGARYVIDAHTTALLAPVWRWSWPLHGFLSRRAVTTLVTNEHLRRRVSGWGAPTFIVADIPAVFPPGRPYPVAAAFNVAVINTFAPDEPLAEVLQAAAALPDVRFYITGDPIRARKLLLREPPANVTFTGFLPDDDYIGMLRAVQAILVLTTRDHTMQRGACEAVALGKPIITSDWPLLREYFHQGTLHVDNTHAGIAAAVRQMQQDLPRLEREVLALQRERWLEWETKQAQLAELLAAGPARPVELASA